MNIETNREQWVASLAGVTGDDELRAVFEHHPEWHDRTSVELLHDEVVRLSYVDADRAGRLATVTHWIAEFLQQPDLSGIALRARAHVHYASTRYAEAFTAYRSALAHFETGRQDPEIARTLMAGVQALIYGGRYDEAREWAERAKVIFTLRGDELRTARCESNIGNILFRQDRYPEALARYQGAWRTIATRGTPRDVIAVLSNIAVCHTSTGEYRQALDEHRQARDLAVREGMQPLAAESDYNIAYIHFLRGEYRAALVLYQTSREACRRAGAHYHAALCDLDEAEMLLELNMVHEARMLAASAASGLARLGTCYERAKALVVLGIACGRQADSPAAAKCFRQARALFRKEGNEQWLGLIDLYQALLQERQGNFAAARRHSRRAAAVLQSSLVPGKAELSALLHARLAIQGGRVELARSVLLPMLASTESQGHRFHCLLLLGDALGMKGSRADARARYAEAAAILDTAGRYFPADEMKMAFLDDKSVVYERIVSLDIESGQPEDAVRAFEVTQRAKSRTLVDRLPASRPVEPVLPRSRELEARQDLFALYRQMENTVRLPRDQALRVIQDLKRRIRQREHDLNRSLSQSRLSGAESDRMPGGALEDIQAAIPPDVTLVEYFIAGDAMNAWVLAAGHIRHVRLGSASHARTTLNSLQFQLGKPRLGSEYASKFGQAMLRAVHEHLGSLYRLLVQPLEHWIETPHVVFAPCGFLHQTPFHILRSADDYLLDRVSVSYAPSASVFALVRKRPVTPSRQSLVLGVADESAPAIDRETEAVGRWLPNSRILRGSEAGIGALRDHAGCRYIHVASHGIFRRDNPMFSAIRLADGYLSLHDLAELSLDAELITLSGCSTGLGVTAGGNEILGLLHGLLTAGARSAVLSLWDVDDQSAVDLMRTFYRTLFEPGFTGSKADALRLAMLDLRQRLPHPYFWAPWVLIGRHEHAR